MVKLKEELLKTLQELRKDEFKEFKWFLAQDDILEGFKGIPVFQLEKADRPGTVDLLVEKHQYPGALQVTMKVLEKMNKEDLVQRLQHLPSGPKAGGIMEKLKVELLKTLEELKEDEFKEFKWFLQQDDILEGFKGIPRTRLEKAGRRDTVDLLVEKHQGHGALQLTMKVLEKIHRNDLVQRLQHLPSGPKGVIMVKLKEELLKTLKELSDDEFKDFKWFLRQDDILEGFKGIPRTRLEKAERPDTVDLMIQKHQGHGALQLTMKVLEKMNRNDLVQRLQHLPSGPKGPGPAETPSVPADKKLKSVRRQFIDGVSEPVLLKLLDILLERDVITDDEMESAGSLNRADKARLVIDVVRKKGTKASSALIAALCEVDRCLSEELNLR